MAKVTLVETPTEQVLRAQNKTAIVTDKLGRKITLKKPNVLATYNLVRMVGAEDAQNQVYMAMIMPLLYVTEIDGVPTFLTNKSEIDALIQRLDEEGISAVTQGFAENFSEQLVTKEEAQAEIKK